MHNIVINNTGHKHSFIEFRPLPGRRRRRRRTTKIKPWPKRLYKVWPNWYYGRNDYGRTGTMAETTMAELVLWPKRPVPSPVP